MFFKLYRLITIRIYNTKKQQLDEECLSFDVRLLEKCFGSNITDRDHLKKEINNKSIINRAFCIRIQLN